MDYRPHTRSIPDIITELLGQFPVLVRKEAKLARVELSEKISQMGAAVGLIVGGAVLTIPALVVLLQAAAVGLEQAGLHPAVAALIAGGVALVIGLILLMVGIGRLKAKNLMPERTIHQLEEDASAAKRQMRTDNEHQRAA